MDASDPGADPIDDDRVCQHFDYLAPELGQDLHATLARLRESCPVAHSDARGGYWVVSRYRDVLSVAQDWETFSSELGVSIPRTQMVSRAIPVHIDPPLHREYKRLITAHLTPAAVAPWEAETRRIATGLIDQFADAGSCDVMADFAVPFPGLAFFRLALGAPDDELVEVNGHATAATRPDDPDPRRHWVALGAWIDQFLETRRRLAPRGDVVDAVLAATIEGRPIRPDEVHGIVLLLILGGLDTTAGALGQIVIRLCQQPELAEMLGTRPELVAPAVEELLRLDGSFVGIGRTVRHDTELDGQRLRAGDKVLISWASANRDADEFDHPEEFRIDRRSNRHLSFGAGPHRCAGSNVARLNLRVAIEELTGRLDHLELAVPADEIRYHTAFNRSPLAVPIRFDRVDGR